MTIGESIEELKSRIDKVENFYPQYWLKEMESYLINLRENYKKLAIIPHKCPCCKGRGKKNDKICGRIISCISCEGKGIVWG